MQNRDISTTFLKGLALLRAFETDAVGLTLAELARRTGYDRATVRRLCLTLVEAGYMTQSERGFRLSPRVLTLAGSFLRANEIGYSVQPVLNEHAGRLGEEISLAVRDGERALYVAQSATVASRVSFGMTVGSTLPLLTTAAGRMILATLPPEERAGLIRDLPIERHTPETTTDRDEIAATVEDIARTGLARADGQYEAGISGLAVAVRRGSRVAGVVGTTLPLGSPEFDRRAADAVSALQRAAADLAGLQSLDHW